MSFNDALSLAVFSLMRMLWGVCCSRLKGKQRGDKKMVALLVVLALLISLLAVSLGAALIIR